MSTKRLKISVCIVTYNHGEYIDDCLASVLAQQLDADIEILVGDDCSSDQTREIISAYSNRYPQQIFPVFHETNIGGSQNYRELILRASGNFIAHLDGDDFWLPGKLSAQILFLAEHPQCVAAYCNAIVIDNAGKLTGRFNRHVPEEFDLNFLVGQGNFLNASSLIYRRGFKDQLLSLKGDTLDYLYHIQLASRGRLGYVNRDLVAYRINSSTSISDARRELLMQLYWSTILKALSLGADTNALRQCLRGYYRGLIRSAFTRGKMKEALQISSSMRRECPLISPWLICSAIASIPKYALMQLYRKLGCHIFKGGVEILFDR